MAEGRPLTKDEGKRVKQIPRASLRYDKQKKQQQIPPLRCGRTNRWSRRMTDRSVQRKLFGNMGNVRTFWILRLRSE